MVKVGLLYGVLVLSLSTSGAAQDIPRPLYTIDLSSLTPSGSASNVDATVTFVTDHILAAGMCYRSTCNLQTSDLSNGRPHQIGQANGIDHFRAIFRRSDGRVLLAGVRRRGEKGAILLGQDLRTSEWIPTVPGFSAAGEKIPEGQGRLLTHTANLAAYLDQDAVRIQGSGGNLLGSFHIALSNRKPTPAIIFLGRNRIMFEDGGKPEVRDFNGVVLRKLRKPDKALGERMRQSEEGTRLLYDSFTRRVGRKQSIVEKALVLPTMGMSTDGYTPNSEVVRVIDTNNGKQCFQWEGKDKLLPPFADHADIDPSGHFVAIITRGTLAVFRLPDGCADK